MAQIKSAYITAYAPFLIIMLIHSIYGVVTDPMAWAGTLTVILTISVCFGWLFLPQVARTSEYLLPFSLTIFTGVVLTISSYISATPQSIFPFTYTLINTVYWLGYLFWYSPFERPATDLLIVGEVLPQFFVEDVNGYPKNSITLQGKPTIFMFYRGNWCPMCMGQVREIASMYQELNKRGVEIALISPQPHGSTQRLAEKYKVPFHFWVDTENKVAQMLGIEEKFGVPLGFPGGYSPDTVLPTVIITDEEGKIIFVDLTDNYRIRPEPQTFFDIIDTHLETKEKVAVPA